MSRYWNRTRSSRSIPRKLLREGRPFLIPLYYLLLTSELASEGIRNSGSYRFADHIYAGRPAGKLLIGSMLDAVLLRLPSARAFRARYVYAKDEVRCCIAGARAAGGQFAVLAVPSGYARELMELAPELADKD
ncbi:MAG: hypothetical protein M3281_06410, partial [Chloroflexota bacterium]|nr:hypothetical protein [Chloroflexota bacterium]